MKNSVRADRALAACWKCGAQTTKVVVVEGVPRHICQNGRANMPFCDACYLEHWAKPPRER
jgi:hypothetical protein